MKTKSTMFLCIFILVILVSGYTLYQKFFPSKVQAPTINSNIGNIYKNTEYGFQITFPESWKDYTIVKNIWQGWNVQNDGAWGDQSGPIILFKNPRTTPQQAFQDIPIMVFTPDVWALVKEGKVGVSAAPILPAVLGQNAKYIFATPPRWYGFTDDQGWQEAVDIVKTFKAF